MVSVMLEMDEVTHQQRFTARGAAAEQIRSWPGRAVCLCVLGVSKLQTSLPRHSHPLSPAMVEAVEGCLDGSAVDLLLGQRRRDELRDANWRGPVRHAVGVGGGGG